ncbi:MAG: FHA domain-containing protein [Chthoniobacterales bacterium]
MPELKVLLSPDAPFTLELTEDKVSVGRLADNELHIPHDSVSSRHAELVSSDGSYLLKDLDSTNGTFVNGEQISEKLLTEGDSVRFGRVDAVYGSEKTGDAEQPEPQSSKIDAATGAASNRPQDFKNSSPFSKEIKEKDPFKMLAVFLVVLGFLAVVASLAVTFMVLKTPTF